MLSSATCFDSVLSLVSDQTEGGEITFLVRFNISTARGAGPRGGVFISLLARCGRHPGPGADDNPYSLNKRFKKISPKLGGILSNQ